MEDVGVVIPEHRIINHTNEHQMLYTTAEVSGLSCLYGVTEQVLFKVYMLLAEETFEVRLRGFGREQTATEAQVADVREGQLLYNPLEKLIWKGVQSWCHGCI